MQRNHKIKTGSPGIELNTAMNLQATWLLAFLLATGCAVGDDSRLANALADYKANLSYGSLEIIADHLKKGMPRKDVEKLLGGDPHCPVSDICYYESDSTAPMGNDPTLTGTWTLEVSYRDPQGNETDRLQAWEMALIAE